MSDPTSRGAFARFFLRKNLALLRAALDTRQRRPRYRDPAVIEAIAAGYRDLAVPVPAPHPIPRHIFMLWQQGWDSAPRLVQHCARSWEERNPGWVLHRLDEATISDFAPDWADYRSGKASRQARSDMARLALLKANGGIWADATLFCTRPLDDWLPVAAKTRLFIFSEPRPYRLMDVWFIAASEANRTIAAWHDMAVRYWQHFDRPHHYYWMPYLFEHLAATDPAVAEAWAAVPKLSALGPLAVQGNPFDPDAPRAIFDLIAENRVPLHKLSHKWGSRGKLRGTPLGMLTGLEKL